MLEVQTERFKVNDLVQSVAGMRGTVTRVLEHKSGRTYVVRWQNGVEGRIAPCNLRRAHTYTQGTVDGHWYYAIAPVDRTNVNAWTGPFMTHTDAVRHSQGKQETVKE